MAEYDRDDSKIDDIYNAEAAGRNAEDSAAMNFGAKNGTSGDTDDARAREEDVPENNNAFANSGGGFTNRVMGKNAGGGKLGKSGLGGKLGGIGGKLKGIGGKAAIPIVIIVGIIIVVFLVVGLLVSNMLIHINYMAMQQKDNSYASRTVRVSGVEGAELNNLTPVDAEYAALFPEDDVDMQNKFRSVSADTVELLRSNNFTVTTEQIGNNEDKLKITSMVWTDRNGNDVQVTGANWSELYENNGNFRDDYSKASRGIYGRIGSWDNENNKNYLDNYNIDRDSFRDWKNDDSNEGMDGVSALTEAVEKRQRELSVSDSTNYTEIENKTDGGECTNYTEITGVGRVCTSREEGGKIPGEFQEKGQVDTQNTGSGDVTAQTQAALSRIAGATTSMECAAADVVSTAANIDYVLKEQDSLHSASAILEAGSKVMAGEGAASPYHQMGLLLNLKDADGSTALESEDAKLLISGGVYTPDKNAQTIQERNVEAMYKEYGQDVTRTSGCAASHVQSVSSSSVTSGDSIQIGTYATGKAYEGTDLILKSGAVKSLATGSAYTDANSGAMTEKILALQQDGKDCIRQVGKTLGTCALGEGISKYISGNDMGTGLTAGNYDAVAATEEKRQLALEYEAEYDRTMRSPFDATNPNTFLGAIISKIGATFNQSGLLSTIGSINNTVVHTLAGMMPTGSAYDKVLYVNNTTGENCDQLTKYQVSGNLYCAPRSSDDYSTTNSSAEQVVVKVAALGGFEMENGKVKTQNGSEVIAKGSNLSKFITACVNRASQIGVLDQNIWGQLSLVDAAASSSSSSGQGFFAKLSATIKKLISGSSATESDESIYSVSMIPWASYSNCVNDGSTTKEQKYLANVDSDLDTLKNSVKANGDNEEIYKEVKESMNRTFRKLGGNKVDNESAPEKQDTWDYVPWEEIKWYQRYVEDAGIIQSAMRGVKNTTSAVTAYVDEMNVIFPKDNSVEGQLALMTGETPERIAYTLDVVAYINYLAQYEPDDLGPLRWERQEVLPDVPGDVIADELEAEGVLMKRTIYATMRNRAIATA